ncbi:MAG TPA: EAL domain-containing protein [Telluria sp.]
MQLTPAQLEQAVLAIREGKADALFLADTERQWLFTLSGADSVYRLLIENMSEGALTITAEGVIAYANQRFADFLERPLHRVIGAHIASCFAPEAKDALLALLAEGTHGKRSIELDLRTEGGARVPTLLSASPLLLKGLPGAVCMIATDLTGQKRGEAAIQARQTLLKVLEEQRLAAEQLMLAAKVFEQSSEGIMITDAMNNIIKINPAFSAITGFSQADVLGKNPRMLGSGCHDAEFFRAMWDTLSACGRWQGEVWNRHKNGSLYLVSMSLSRVSDASGRPTQYIASFSDITQRKEAESHMLRMAHFDPLTGLPNRALLSDRATHAFQEANRNQESITLMFIDLDRFKNVNDSLGHRIGDALLMEVAARMKNTLREQDTVSRVGGDEFVLLLPDTDATGAAHLAQKLVSSLRLPFQIGEHELMIGSSIGIALYPGDGTDFEVLCKSADAAMYRAKQEGGNAFHFYTDEIQARSERILSLENALRHALERGQMQLYYQPQKSFCGGRIFGAEALLRWQHPKLGVVSPGEFIPIAENSGLINSIGEWVLRTAVQQMRAWLDAGMAPITIAVNLSAVQFRQKNLLDLVSLILEEAGIPPQYLELELTESVASDDPLGAIAVMDKLNARGIRMSIDDFGTGYSSLSYLKRFKAYRLKIDKSFVHNITENAEDQAIVTAIISLASSLGMQTIAEGVETAAQMAFLRDKGCDEMQGYWLSWPLPAEQFRNFIEAAQ